VSKKRTKHQENRQRQPETVVQTEKTALSLKEMLDEQALAKLKGLEKAMKEEQERAAQEEAERRRREQEERERNKSFADLLAEYEKKGGGKYS